MSNAPSSAGSSVISGSDRKRRNKYRDYSYLTSTNLIYRDQLPPQYTLPTLIGVPAPDLRGLNTIDNEEQIPDLDFREAVKKFNKNYNSSDNLKLRKTYSENELSKYDFNSGRRKSVTLYNDEGIELTCNLRKKDEDTTDSSTFWEPDYYHSHAKRAIFHQKYSKEEVFDEYIPTLSQFNLKKFGIDEHVIVDDDYDDKFEKKEIVKIESKKRKSRISDAFERNHEFKKEKLLQQDERSIFGVTPECAIEPINIENVQKNTIDIAEIKADFTISEFFPVSDECFKIAGSPERDTDRSVLSSIPKHFYSLSFSNRKKVLSTLLPDDLRGDTNYKEHISKILRKNSASFSNPNSSTSLEMFAPDRRRDLRPKENENKLGSIILNKWRLGRVFNNGSFGIIRECFDVNDYENVKAVKIIPIKKDQTKLFNSKPEIKIWSVLSDPTIVPLLDVKITSEFVFMIMPLYNEGSLFDKVKSWETQNVCLNDRIDDIFQYSEIIAKGLKYLHGRGLHHGDVKLENCLLDNNNPKLCDFGTTNFDFNVLDDSTLDISKKFKQYLPTKLTKSITNELNKALLEMNQISSEASDIDTTNSVSSSFARSASVKSNYGLTLSADIIERTHTNVNDSNAANLNEMNIGSLPYAAPELLKPCPIPLDKSADIWAFGVLVYTLIGLKLPFWHIYEPRLKLKIMEGNWETEEWKNCMKFESENNIKLRTLNEIIKGCLCERNVRYDVFQINEIFTKAIK